MKIDINELQENSYNPNSMSELKFNGLVASIKEENGNRLFPIEVLPQNEQGKYVIIDGAHRFKAMKQLGITEAIIEISSLDEGHTKLRTISKNRLHGEHDQLLESEIVKELIEEHGIQEDELLSAFGIDKQELITIENLTEVDLDDFDTGESIEELVLDNEESEDIELEDREDKKDLELHLSRDKIELLLEMKKITKQKTLEDALFYIAYYYKLQHNEEEIDILFKNSALKALESF